MTTIQQQMQTGSEKAHEIFAKLADTSATALKTRDRLFSDLKAELDRQAKFEEQRLFPVLRKHKEAKDLVAQAQNDNQQARKLLAELEGTPKDSEAFGAKVAELRTLFQRRLRDDKNEVLPAVVKALDEDEASSAARKTEGETSEVSPARRVDEGEHRPEAEHETAAEVRRSADLPEAGTAPAQHDAPVARVARGADVDRREGHDHASRSATAAEDAQWRAARADMAAAGLSMVTLLSEQAQQALQLQAVMTARRAQRLAEMAQMQSALMAASFQRMGQLNDRYLAVARDWRGFVPFMSTQR